MWRPEAEWALLAGGSERRPGQRDKWEVRVLRMRQGEGGVRPQGLGAHGQLQAGSAGPAGCRDTGLSSKEEAQLQQTSGNHGGPGHRPMSRRGVCCHSAGMGGGCGSSPPPTQTALLSPAPVLMGDNVQALG